MAAQARRRSGSGHGLSPWLATNALDIADLSRCVVFGICEEPLRGAVVVRKSWPSHDPGFLTSMGCGIMVSNPAETSRDESDGLSEAVRVSFANDGLPEPECR